MPGMAKTMHEFKHGTLHSGSKHGPVVKSRKQAIAIGMSEARKGGGKKHHSSHGKHDGKHGPAFGAAHNTDHHSLRHSSLRSQDNADRPHSQPRGKATVHEHDLAARGKPAAHNGVSALHSPHSGKAEHHPRAGAPHKFEHPHSAHAHGFRGRRGHDAKGGHRIGHR